MPAFFVPPRLSPCRQPELHSGGLRRPAGLLPALRHGLCLAEPRATAPLIFLYFACGPAPLLHAFGVHFPFRSSLCFVPFFLAALPPSPLFLLPAPPGAKRMPRGKRRGHRHAPPPEPTISPPSPPGGCRQILHQGGSSLADALANIPGVSAAPASRPAPAARSSAAWMPAGYVFWKTAPAVRTPPISAPIMACRSIRSRRAASKWCAARRPCAMAARRSAAWSMPSTTAFRWPCPTSRRGSQQAAYRFRLRCGPGTRCWATRDGNFAFHVDGFYRHTDDYDTPLGHRPTPSSAATAFRWASSYFFGRQHSRIGAAVVHYDSKYGIPGDTTFIDMRQTKLLPVRRWIWVTAC